MNFLLFMLRLLTCLLNKYPQNLAPKLYVEINKDYVIEMNTANFTAKLKTELIPIYS